MLSMHYHLYVYGVALFWVGMIKELLHDYEGDMKICSLKKK
jgi:hypothetical protein